MAEPHGGNPTRMTPAKVLDFIGLLLQAADAILRIFGRRSTDRLGREKPNGTPPGDDPGGELQK